MHNTKVELWDFVGVLMSPTGRSYRRTSSGTNLPLERLQQMMSGGVPVPTCANRPRDEPERVSLGKGSATRVLSARLLTALQQISESTTDLQRLNFNCELTTTTKKDNSKGQIAFRVTQTDLWQPGLIVLRFLLELYVTLEPPFLLC